MIRSNRSALRLVTLVLASIVSGALPRASAQEFLDTAGRWKQLSFGDEPIEANPWVVATFRSTIFVGRERGSLLVSRDTGESWRELATVLPAGTSIIWAIAWPDTLDDPRRVVAVASLGQGDSMTTAIIESTDDGLTWTRGASLAPMDTFLRQGYYSVARSGPPGILFDARDPRYGFIWSGANLMATSDGGRSWEVRDDDYAFRSLTMSDPLRGIAIFGGPGFPVYGIFTTGDGCRTWELGIQLPASGTLFQHMHLTRFSAAHVKVVVPKRTSNFLDWWVYETTDGGATWSWFERLGSKRPLAGTALFRGPDDVHFVIDGAILMHSPDGANSMYMLRDTTPEWFLSQLDLIPHTRYPATAKDDRYIYLSIEPDIIVRWRMAPVAPLSGVAAATVPGGPAPLRVMSSILDPRQITVDLDAIVPADAVLSVYDVRGIAVWSARRRPGGSRIAIALDGLPVGRYVIVASTPTACWSAPIVVR